jgi:hypothetical protein
MKYRDRLFTKSPNRDRQKNRLRNTAITFSPKELNRDRETNTLRKTAIAFAQNYPKPRSPKKTL